MTQPSPTLAKETSFSVEPGKSIQLHFGDLPMKVVISNAHGSRIEFTCAPKQELVLWPAATDRFEVRLLASDDEFAADATAPGPRH